VHDRQSNNGPQQLVHIFRCSQHVRNHDQQHWKQCCLFYVCTVCALTERCSGVYECSCQTYKTQYALTVAVIQSSSRDTIFSKKARARPSLTSSNIPVVLTSKCLQQHTVCDQKQLSLDVNLWHMLQLSMTWENAGNTAAQNAVCRSTGFNLSVLLLTLCCILKTQCTAFTQQEFVQCSDACSR